MTNGLKRLFKNFDSGILIKRLGTNVCFNRIVNMIRKQILLLSIIFLLFASNLFSMNIIESFDIFLRPQPRENKHFQIFGWAGAGLDAQGYDICGNRVNILRIWNKNQNALAMLNGYDPLTPIGQLRVQLGDDYCCRGHLCVDGELKPIGATIAARYVFPYNISLGLYLPVYSMKLDKVIWRDLTPVGDTIVRDNLTNNFPARVMELGCLDICGWRRTGLGDLTLVGEWQGMFKQNKPILKKVIIDVRLKLSMPTGLKRDEDKIFALPFGSDGAWDVMFGTGLDFIWADYVRGGFDVELNHRFGNRKVRRIKTDLCQTDLLLLQKECTYKDCGLTQQFTLHAGVFKLLKGFSLDVGYRFTKHGDDTLTLEGSCFSDKIANSAESLKEWTSHQALIKVDYDFGYHMSEDAAVIPTIGLYGRLPFNGKRVVLSPSFGVIMSVDF